MRTAGVPRSWRSFTNLAHRKFIALVSALVTALVVISAVPAVSADDFSDLAAAAARDSAGVEPIPAPSSQTGVGPETLCSSPVPGTDEFFCMSKSDGAAGAEAGAAGEAGIQSLQAVPEWCKENFNRGRYATRTQDCQTFSVLFTKYVYTNGTWNAVGTADLTVYSYQYSQFDDSKVGHQYGFSAARVSGDLSGITLSAASQCSGACVALTTGNITPAPITLYEWREAESYYEPTDTVLDSIHYFGTAWGLSAALNGVSQSTLFTEYNDIRCDHASGGAYPKAGCAVWWAPCVVTYSRTSLPTLTAHIEQAHLSGLRGSSVYNPLHRTQDLSIRDANRQAACPTPPGIPGFSCDEYPFASTREGGASGGTARSFPNCVYLDPPATGPVGFSRCAIDEHHNSSGGTILTNTYRQQRILDGDPFFVAFIN